MDFNSLDVEACWTTGGANATCPYSQTLEQTDDLRRRIILVSVDFLLRGNGAKRMIDSHDRRCNCIDCHYIDCVC